MERIGTCVRFHLTVGNKAIFIELRFQMNRSPVSVLSQTDLNGMAIPVEQLEANLRDLLTTHGYVLLTNVLDDFDHVLFCQRLGSLIPHINGATTWDIRPEPDNKNNVYYPGSNRTFAPHTECFDFQGLPPRYLSLWCIHPAFGEGGETTVADTFPWIDQLSDSERERLEEVKFDWENPHGSGLGICSQHPVIERFGGDRIVRFSCKNLVHSDGDSVADLIRRWQLLFDHEHVAIRYERNDMLVFDNWRMLHGRSGFQDLRRHLRRVQIGAVIDKTSNTAVNTKINAVTV